VKQGTRTARGDWRTIRGISAVGLLVLGWMVFTPFAGASITSPRVATAPEPTGWVPVSFGKAQISVPKTWTIISGGAAGCSSTTTGVLILGSGTWCPPSMNMSAQPGTSLVTISPLRDGEEGSAPEISIASDGRAVFGHGISSEFRAPTLGIKISVSGPPQYQVLHSLTYSPWAIALAPKRGGSVVPDGWRHLSFAGVRFAVPATWGVHRMSHASACQTDFALQAGVHFASTPALPFSCPYIPPEDQLPSAPAIEIDRFWMGNRSGPCVGPTRINGVRLCVESSAAYGVLTAKVEPPGHPAVTIKIALTGNGELGRTVLRSLAG
jgi:hypothetical protein